MSASRTLRLSPAVLSALALFFIWYRLVGLAKLLCFALLFFREFALPLLEGEIRFSSHSQFV